MARYWCARCSESTRARPAHAFWSSVSSIGCGLTSGLIAFAGMIAGYAVVVSSHVPIEYAALFTAGGLLIALVIKTVRYRAAVRSSPVCRDCGSRLDEPTAAALPWTGAAQPVAARLSSGRQDLGRAPGGLTCPRCHSDQILVGRRGYSWKKGGATTAAALVAMPLFGMLSLAGMAAGTHGRTRVRLECLNCGRQWRPGRP